LKFIGGKQVSEREWKSKGSR